VQRLRQRHEFEAVLAHGRTYSSRLYIVRVKPCNSLSIARLGIIAARRALPRAVDRNRGKRLVREAFRQAHQSLAEIDVVVQLRSTLATKDNATVRNDLLGLFAKISKDHDGGFAPRPNLTART
jgi:ribonuclease P protein component